jgi:hypothetical protein
VKPGEDIVRAGLADALDGVLVALLAHRGVTDAEVPVVALDCALRADDAHVRARARLRVVIKELREVLGEERLDLLLTVEEAATEVAVAATSVGFRLGVAKRRSA